MDKILGFPFPRKKTIVNRGIVTLPGIKALGTLHLDTHQML